MEVSMLNRIHACNVFSKSFQANIQIFHIYNQEPDAQNGKGSGIKVPKNYGS